ncbi:MAG TPA: protoheme IX farnesyltransferase [Chromatiales bacterium]|nr:protoheme IX farnesyltransferase [Chromatiales bacterium]
MIQATALPLPQKLRSIYELAKPKVVALIVFTAFVGMLLASPPDMIDGETVFFAMVGIALASAAGAAINHLLDERYDAVMDRTHNRPLPSARVNNREVLLVALSWAALSMGILAWQVNVLTAVLTFMALIGYAVIYTVYLKHSTPQNIVWGGAAGAAPPLLGWTAMTGQVTVEGLILFLIIFLWTPPHFWPLAIRRVEEYRRAGIPMLPVVKGIQHTKYQILLYTMVLVSVSLLPTTVGMSGLPYFIAAAILGVVYLMYAWRLYRDPENRLAMPTFGYSILYLMLLFAALLVDHYLS